MSELAPGTQFGRYRIESVLGRGGFGIVYLATDTNPQLPRRVALKVLKAELGTEPTFRERFFRESRLAASLDEHPNILPVFDAGDLDHRLFIAMRYVEGTDLHSAIVTNGALDPLLTVSIVSQIAGALDAAHSVGIVHRDVKPGNILLSSDLRRAYLGDFGLTKSLSSDSVTLSETGMFLGTVAYAAPEQLDGRPTDARADQYALACTMYECLTGSIPFGGDAKAIMFGHMAKAPPTVTQRCPWMPSSIDSVVQRGMSKEPDYRYESCGKLAAEATRALDADRSPAYSPILARENDFATTVRPTPSLEQTRRDQTRVVAGPLRPAAASVRSTSPLRLIAAAAIFVALALAIAAAAFVSRQPARSGRSATSSTSALAMSAPRGTVTWTPTPTATTTPLSALTQVKPPGQAYAALVPADWVFADVGTAGGSPTHVWSDPHDASRRLRVVITTCSSCLADPQNPTAAPDPMRVVPAGVKDSVRLGSRRAGYLIFTPDNPYPDNGLIVVRAAGGYAQLDLWLPESEHSRATSILDSFTSSS